MSRDTFPHIISFNHPLADGSRVAPTFAWPRRSPDVDDFKIAEEVMIVHRQLKKMTPADGEWSWINSNKKKNYLEALQKEDTAKLAEIFANMFREDAIYGLISSDFSTVYGLEDQRVLENSILLDLDAWREFTEQNDKDLSFLDMPRVGNPYGILINNILISADSPRHDYFSLKLMHLMKEANISRPHILEIGGGYGGLAFQLQRRISSLVYINCDLPESLYLAYYFLRKATNKKIVWALGAISNDIYNADIIMIPAQNAGSIIVPIDVIFNCNSFSEMTKNTVGGYINLLHNLRPLYFLHQNSNFLLFPNSSRHIEVLASTFPIDYSLYKEVYRAISPWQGGGGRYREFLYCRR